MHPWSHICEVVGPGNFILETALNHNANLFIQNAVCSVGISSTEKGILRLKAVLQRESMCKYAPTLLRRAFDLLFTYYLLFRI